MLLIPWKASQGWGTPEIKPCMSPRLDASRFCTDLCFFGDQDGPLSLDPSSTVLHYAQCIFEGLKAYRNKNGKVTVFRPELNMQRMNTSAQRLALPVSSVHETWRHEFLTLTLTVQKTFNGTALLDLIKELVRLDRHWIPQVEGHSLYIRPVMSAFLGILILSKVLIGTSPFCCCSVGTQTTVGITPPDSALLFVICSPVGPYYPDGFKPVALHGTSDLVRAFPGGQFRVWIVLHTTFFVDHVLVWLGTGAYKIGANYAPGVFAQKEAAKMGYVQNLWLHGPEHYLTEVRTFVHCAQSPCDRPWN